MVYVTPLEKRYDFIKYENYFSNTLAKLFSKQNKYVRKVS